MRILQCIPNMNSGGAEQQLVYLCGGLVRMGHEVHVLVARKGELFGALEASGATVHLLAAGNNHSPRIPIQITKTITRVKPAIVQTWFRQMDVVAGLAAIVAKIPWVISERSSEAAYLSSTKDQVRSILAKWADAVICNSQGGSIYWEKRRGALKRFIIPNAVPIEAIDAAAPLSQTAELFDAAEHVVISVGRLSEEKNLEVFLRAVAEVRQTIPIVAVICGEGPERKALEGLIGSLGLQDAVLLLGYVENVWSWVKRAAVFVSLSTFEGNPNAVLEAMACRCPMVLSDIPAHRETCTEHMASFVDPTSSESVARSILKLLMNRAAATAQVAIARARVENRSILQMATNYVSAYHSVVKSR